MKYLRSLARIFSHSVVIGASACSGDAGHGVPMSGRSLDAALDDVPSMKENHASLAGDGAKRCSPFGMPECARGETCCVSGLVGACTSLDSCSTTTRFDCSQASSCSSGEFCCGAFYASADGGVTATTLCAKSCASPTHAICRTSGDCPAGQTCTVLPEGASSPILAAAVESFSACLPRDGSAGP